MGLILIPSEVTQKTEAVCASITGIADGYQRVLQTVQNFTNENELDTEAWNTLKVRVLDYHQNIALGIIAIEDSVISDAASLQQSVGTEDLYEDTLIEIIEKLEKNIEEYENQIKDLEAISSGLWGNLISNACEWIKAVTEMLQEEIDKLNQVLKMYREKLQFLYDVESSTQSLYETSVQLLSAVGAAINDAGVEITGVGERSDGSWKLKLDTAITQMDEKLKAFVEEALQSELNIDLNELEELYGEDIVNRMINIMKENGISRLEEGSAEKYIEIAMSSITGYQVMKIDGKYEYVDEEGIKKELTVGEAQKVFQTEAKTIIYIKNLTECDLEIVSEKREEMIIMGETLLRKGYECAFVAGILANIASEGTAGLFESSNYIHSPEPNYLVYLDEYFNYRAEFSGKNISQVGIAKTKELIENLEASDSIGKFGLGCAQWTKERTKGLLDCYIEVCGENNYPSKEQCLQAESLYIAKELNTTYKKVYENWKKDSGGEESGKSANIAGKIVCEQYESPKTDSSTSRAKMSEEIYGIMIGEIE